MEQRRQHKKKPMHIWPINFWERSQEYTVGKDSLFKKWCCENWTSSCKRMTLDPHLTSCTGMSSKWIKDLTIGPQTIQLLEEDIEGKAPWHQSWVWFFFFFKGLHLRHMEVPRLGVELEPQLPAYTTTIATWDPSCGCNLHRSSRQCQIFNPSSEARDQTHILTDTSRIHFHCATTGTPLAMIFIHRIQSSF